MSADRAALIQQRLRARGLPDRPGSEPIRRRPGEGPAPLSLNQEGIWFIHSLDPDKPTYNIPGVVRLRGNLDVGALEASLGHLQARHEALRTVFDVDEDGVPFQIVQPVGDFQLPLIDLSALPRSQKEAAVRKRAHEDAAKPFDLSIGPLFTAFLLRLGEREHALVLKVHHLVVDGWSWGILTREMRTLYRAFARSEPVSLPANPIDYGDFCVWQRKWLEGGSQRELSSYWSRQLAGAPTLELPTDRKRLPSPSYRGAHEAVHVSRSLSNALRRLARDEGHTLFTVLLTGFNILLREWSGQEDIVVGATFANRTRRELEDVVGYFVTLLPLRCQTSLESTGTNLLRRVGDTTTGAIAHQAIPLTQLARALGIERRADRTPLFQTVFYLLTPDVNPAVFGFGLPGAYEAIDMDGIRITPIETECGLARFDLMLLLWDHPEGLRGTVEYSTDLFDRSTIRRRLEELEVILAGLVAQPELSLEDLLESVAEEMSRSDGSRAAALKKHMNESLQRLGRRGGQGP